MVEGLEVVSMFVCVCVCLCTVSGEGGGGAGGVGRWNGGGMFKGARSPGPARLSRQNAVDEVSRHRVGLGWAGLGWAWLG